MKTPPREPGGVIHATSYPEISSFLGFLPLLVNFFAFQVQPEIKLRSLVQNYRAAETKVVPLGERDVAPDSHRVYELQGWIHFSSRTDFNSDLSRISSNLAIFDQIIQGWAEKRTCFAKQQPSGARQKILAT